jgi:hypothetical protein
VVLHAGATGLLSSLRLTLRDVFWHDRFLPVEGLQLDQGVDVPLFKFMKIIVRSYRFNKGLPPTTRFNVPSNAGGFDKALLKEVDEDVPETALERAEREAWEANGQHALDEATDAIPSESGSEYVPAGSSSDT